MIKVYVLNSLLQTVEQSALHKSLLLLLCNYHMTLYVVVFLCGHIVLIPVYACMHAVIIVLT